MVALGPPIQLVSIPTSTPPTAYRYNRLGSVYLCWLILIESGGQRLNTKFDSNRHQSAQRIHLSIF